MRLSSMKLCAAACVAAATGGCRSPAAVSGGAPYDAAPIPPAEDAEPGLMLVPPVDFGLSLGVDAGSVVVDGVPPQASYYCEQGDDVKGVLLPAEFCLRRFATIGTPRTLVFAPNGDLIVGSPSASTAGGASGGQGAIVILSDDNQDGQAEIGTFADSIADVHGLALGAGYLYFTTAAAVWRTPFASGQRKETPGARTSLGIPLSFSVGGRWTHGLTTSVGGQIYASRGEYGTCGGSGGGEIARVGMNLFQPVAKGFRNPMYMRCHAKDEICAATELGEDQTPGAREKLLFLRPGTEYGYPCCFSASQPVQVAMGMTCGQVTKEEASFTLADTPFGFDWEPEMWPEMFRGGIFVALHGSFYSSPSWAGARIVFAKTDPVTRRPIEGWRDFVRGFGPGDSPLDRPSDVAFSPDGRLFFSDDQGGAVYWVAPRSLAKPK